LIRLGIDSRDAFSERPRGVGKALNQLIRHLIPLISDWQVNLYTNRAENVEFPAPTQIRRIDIRGDRFNTWEQIRLPLAALASRLDLLHCPSQTAPPFTPCPVVLTIHDLIPLRMDDGWPPGEVSRFRKALARSVANARRIITVSEFTKKDLLSSFNIPENKVDVVWWGVDRKVATPSQELWENLYRTHGIRSPFFVAFGGEAPRKNVPRILEALNFFVREVNGNVQLLLLGVPPQSRAKFATIAESLDVSRNMIQIGYVPDATVAELLARSEAVVYPSLYEGFGLPILEAMAARS
jgi:glycosyltransferase involved in cell wall biosynthesis